ncbi:MAG: PAS domain S-box protein [Symploca sp. SIO3E6]|nr:PAS domain S-box protein [Caldora sp. SIO3E6]
MNANALEEKIETAQQCLAALLRRADELLLPQEKFFATLLEELFVNLKQLQGSIEELQSKNEELTYSYLAWETALQQCQMNYGSLVGAQGELVCRFESIGTITFVNPTFANYFGKQPQELIGQNWISMALEADQEALLKHLASLNRGNSLGTREHRVKLSNGEIRWQQWHHQAIFNTEGEFIEFLSRGQDIICSAFFRCQQAENKRVSEKRDGENSQQTRRIEISPHISFTQKKTPLTNKQLPEVLDILPGAVAWISADLKFLGVNRYLARTWGLPPETFIGEEVGSLKNLVDFRKFVQKFFHSPMEQSSQEVEIEVDGTLRYYLFVGYQYGSPGEAVFLGTDITEYKQTQQQLEAAIAEKEICLQKLHHRVKNNFQTIYSLLQFQSSQIKDRRLLELLRDIQSRLKTMGLLHQKLYHYPDATKVNLADYIQDLANYLFIAYYQESNKVVLKLQMDRVDTGIKTAIACGQIITELLSNSLKHDFTKKNKKEIFINLTHSSSGKMVLIVGDNGVGLPEKIDFNNCQSLGLRLVSFLIQEIQGYSEINGDKGTTFKISFQDAAL